MSWLRWLGAEYHKLLIIAIVIDRAWDRLVRFWDKIVGVEEFIEKRYHERRFTTMNLQAIEAMIGVAKKFIPTLENVITQLPVLAGPVSADVEADIQAVLKTISDLQSAIESLQTTIKAA